MVNYSSSTDVPRAIQGQHKRLSRNECTCDEMAGSMVKSHFICFDFQETFHGTNVFYTLDCRFVRLGFRLLCARLAVHYFAFHSKPQRQRTDGHILRFQDQVNYDAHVKYKG